MSTQRAETSLKTLANANELVCAVAQEVVGNEVADTLNGAPLTREAIYQLAQSHFTNRLSKYLGS